MNWKRALISVLVVLPLIALLGFGLTRDPRVIPSPLPGRDAPPFALEVMRAGDKVGDVRIGDTINLAALRGKVVVLNFWASWCLACRGEHAPLSRTAERYAGKDVQFIGVLYSDLSERGREWIAQMGGQSYPSVTDPRSMTAISYGLYGVPETFLIGRNGRVAYKHIGPITEDVLITKIDSLLEIPGASAPVTSK